MLVTELHTRDIPDIIRRFEKEIGAKHWRTRVRQCKQEIKGNALLKDHLRRENEIAFQLDHVSDLAQKYSQIPIHLTEDRDNYPAISFAAQILSLIDGASKEYAEQVRRRVHGALKNPDDMRGLRLELSAATHFIRRGRRVSWPEITGTGTFDLLVEDISSSGLEVECKSISGDKGRRIHEREVLDFYALMRPRLETVRSGLKKGLCVVLTLPGRLPKTFNERQLLVKQVSAAIFAGTSCHLPGGAIVRINDFDPKSLGDDPFQRDRHALRKIIDTLTETNNRQTLLLGSNTGGILALTIQSAQDDNLIKAMFDTLSDAGKRQLTGTRAGFLYTSLHGLDTEQLRSVGLQDQSPTNPPTALRIGVSNFLNSKDRDNIVGEGFVSRGSIEPREDQTLSISGSAYYFKKRESPFWSDDFKDLFTWEGDT